MTRPLIGITLDWQESGTFSKRPHYALRETYFHAVWAAGGVPVGLPLHAESVEACLAKVDGVVIPGGDYPTPSSWYKDPHNLTASHPRVEIDMLFITRALALDKPLLAICAGFQELAVAGGGHLYWKVSQSLQSPIDHRTGNPAARHSLKIAPGSLLARAVAAERIEVNSAHFEGVADTGGAVASAWADDGLVEAIEIPGKKFALGVQWHPERMGDDIPSRKLFEALTHAAE
jgi:putative glutamine amidotransferase